MRAMMMAVQAHVLRTLLFDPAAIKLPKNRYLIQDNINMSRTALFAIYNTDWKQTKLEDIEQYMSSMSYCTKFIDGSTCEFKTLTSSCLTKTNRENLTEFGFRIHQQCRNASDRSDTTRRSGARPKRHYLEGRKRKNSHALLAATQCRPRGIIDSVQRRWTYWKGIHLDIKYNDRNFYGDMVVSCY